MVNHHHIPKKRVIKYFKEMVLPDIPKDDIPAKREAWNNYVDSLEREGVVNSNRSRNWTNPF